MSDLPAGVMGRLAELGLRPPDAPPPPAGAYVPSRLHAGFGFLAAQVPGEGHRPGRVGAELSVEEGRAAAQSAALNAIVRINEALGGLERLVGLLHVAGHVASAPDFLDQPGILDGASELFTDVLGERGAHSRTAFLAPRLPKDVGIELEITFAYRD